MMFIVDAHLDLSYNALRGRDVLRPAAEQPPDEEGIPSVGLPDLQRGNVGLICATIFCEPHSERKPTGYRSSDEAFAVAREQMAWYHRTRDQGLLDLVTAPNQLSAAAATGGHTSAIILMEGADPFRSTEDVQFWFNQGVRIVGLAWKRTRYAGGTGAPGPLSREGVALVAALDRVHMIHDVSHLAEESFWQLHDLTSGPMMASHSNCRAMVPTDRQLSDTMIRAIIERGGVVGINFFDKFLIPPNEQPRRATLADVVHHVQHICDLAGSATHVGIGTDMDGGLGRDQIPAEISTSADLPRVADALSTVGFSDANILSIMGGNWLRFFRTHLPAEH